MASSDLFANYEQDFTSITESIKEKLERQIPNQKGGKKTKKKTTRITITKKNTIEERKATIRAIEREIDEADEIVSFSLFTNFLINTLKLGQMEMEILNIPTPSRTRLQAKLRLYKSEAEKLKRDLVNTLMNKQEESIFHHLFQRRTTAIVPKNSDREELLGGIGSSDDLQNDYDASTMDQRQRLLSGTERLGQSSRRLEDSHRLALETEGIGINILSTLKGQRETLIRARDTVNSIA